ncbi:hypothetical protein HUT16_03900 [Kitasatospora sp. NA04385]|uniref:hypothetical protein n=1 Tax=Kitasatospora sp. NA04385 TaxID=2742135 RepID=UPI001592720D|nr:hypothetical protein [Kitasatospora sp. NA04385]QKW18320.1 hypothetical protein HUT16_03900 [Kitasatospora sp. NA04385]
MLAWAGVETPADSARAGAELLRSLGGPGWSDLPPGYDACTVHLRPGDLLRRRRLAALAAAVAVALTAGVLPVLLAPGPNTDGPGTGGPGAAASAPAAAAPERRADDLWRTTAKLGLAVWPARGELRDDGALLGRATAAWQQAGRPPPRPNCCTRGGWTARRWCC